MTWPVNDHGRVFSSLAQGAGDGGSQEIALSGSKMVLACASASMPTTGHSILGVSIVPNHPPLYLVLMDDIVCGCIQSGILGQGSANPLSADCRSSVSRGLGSISNLLDQLLQRLPHRIEKTRLSSSSLPSSTIFCMYSPCL